MFRTTTHGNYFPPWRKHDPENAMDVGDVSLRGAKIHHQRRVSIKSGVAEVRSDPGFCGKPNEILQVILRLLLEFLVFAEAGRPAIQRRADRNAEARFAGPREKN